jgi:hypothetical protein
VVPDRSAFTPVGLEHISQFGNKLTSNALVDTCFTVSIDLELVVVVDDRTGYQVDVGVV